MHKVLYIFSGGRTSRLLAARAGQEVPLEFLFGVTYLQERGYAVDVLELSDLTPDESSDVYRRLSAENSELQKVTGFTSTSHMFVDLLDTLNQYDAIVAGGEPVALGLSYFISRGTLRPPMFVLGMGMLLRLGQRCDTSPTSSWLRHVLRLAYYEIARGRSRTRQLTYRHLVESAAGAVYFSPAELVAARRMCPGSMSKIHLAPPPVDTQFWTPDSTTGAPQGFILFMGNDRLRDFDLVIQIATKLPAYQFVFVTSRIRQEQIPPNVTLKQGDWKTSLLSDLEIRDIVRNSAVVFVPVKPGTLFGSTSVALQAMACGKTVVVRETAAWELEFVDREHVWFIRSSGADEWCRALDTLMSDTATRERIGANARSLVEHRNNVNILGANIERLITGRLS